MKTDSVEIEGAEVDNTDSSITVENLLKFVNRMDRIREMLKIYNIQTGSSNKMIIDLEELISVGIDEVMNGK